MSFKCQYCSEEFDSINERGVHKAEEHIRKDEKIPSKSRKIKDNIVKDWDKDE